ncbi:MAG: Fic family protein [Bacillales bacterium]|nr:Fic family protein [Bacillales bacterium]MDY5919824.1 Fic family protein [Candidatus Enteromonas sp.]
MRNFDYSLLRARTFDREVINYIGLIHEFKGRQQLYLEQKPRELETLVEIAKIQSTESSNAIEGITTTKARLKSLMADKTTPRDRGEKEIKGYRHVLDVIHENFDYVPIRKNYILQLHKMLYQFTEERFGGSFKDTPNEIDMVYPDGRTVLLFKPLEPFETPEAVEKLCEEYDKAINKYGIDPLIAIPVFIHDFLCIHPFNDGNGRMSRLLTTLLLYKSGFVIGRYISLEKKIEITKDEYYVALQESSQNWHEEKNDDTAFIKYILGTIVAAYRDFEERVNMLGKKVSARDMVEKAIRSKIGKFTKNDIMELCPEIGRGSVENSLKALCEEGIIKKEGQGRATFYYTI